MRCAYLREHPNVNRRITVRKSVFLRCAIVLAAVGVAAAEDRQFFLPGNLVVSRSVYDNNANTIAVGTPLPPNCAKTTVGCGKTPATATNNGLYPSVFNNNLADGSFGITSKIFLDQVTPFGRVINTLEVPNSGQAGITSSDDQMVTSFSSKSELALHESTDGRLLTFMGYLAPLDAIDVSNSNTPWPSSSDPLNFTVDPTNPVGENVYRVVATVDGRGRFHFMKTNAYSGNNGRAAILNNLWGWNLVYMAGNAGNGANPQPNGIILGAGAQIATMSHNPEIDQSPGVPTPAASFNVTEINQPADKIGKDDNFRGMTIFDDILYYTKGSGGNGVNTVYFVDTTGTACPKGVGVPSPFGTIPKTPLTFDQSTLQTAGLPSNMCILAGFPTVLAKDPTATLFPFSLWFADSKTLYVADEGDGNRGTTADTLYAPAVAQKTAGLQKWVFDSGSKTWKLAYTLTAGLGIGVPYAVPTGYPTGNNAATGLPWAPATDGLRNITGRRNWDGTVTIWGITSTISGSGDQGADPNKLVAITDSLDATTLPSDEQFHALRTAGFGEVLRGVSLTPGTHLSWWW